MFKLIIISFSLLLFGCSSEEAASSKGSIVLTFDDAFTDGWYEAYPEILNRGAIATFFLTNYDNDSNHTNPRQEKFLSKLKIMESAGFEFENHSFEHKRANETIEDIGLEEWFQSEILRSVCPMLEDGFYVQYFAYPHSNSNTKESDTKLLEHFGSIRTYAGLDALPSSGIYSGGNVITAAPIDEKALDMELLKNTLIDVSENNQTIVLAAHDISEYNEKYLYISPDSLYEIIDFALSLGMEFKKISEINSRIAKGFDCE